MSIEQLQEKQPSCRQKRRYSGIAISTACFVLSGIGRRARGDGEDRQSGGGAAPQELPPLPRWCAEAGVTGEGDAGGGGNVVARKPGGAPPRGR